MQLNLRGRLLREGISRFSTQSLPRKHYVPFSFGTSAGAAGRIGLSPFANSFIDTSSLSGTSTVAIGSAGLPCTIVLGGTDLVTTLPAVTIAPWPILTLGSTIAPGPTVTSSPITTPLSCSRKCAMIVARICTVARSQIVTRSGRDVSITASYPIQTFCPMWTPRQRFSHTRRLVAPGTLRANA